jgi:hypothetical protein
MEGNPNGPKAGGCCIRAFTCQRSARRPSAGGGTSGTQPTTCHRARAAKQPRLACAAATNLRPSRARTTQARPVVRYGPRAAPASTNPARRNPPQAVVLPRTLPIGRRRWAETLWSVGTLTLNALRYRFQTLSSRSLTSGSDWPVWMPKRKGCPRRSCFQAPMYSVPFNH